MSELDSVEQSGGDAGTQDASPSSTEQQTSQVESNNQEAKAEAQAIYELEKLGTFKVDGKQISYQDLKKAMMLQKDYTQKTQGLAEERKQIESFKAEQKFRDNLQADLEHVAKNPRLMQDFIKMYPPQYHSLLKFVVNKQAEQAGAQEVSKEQNSPNVDYQLLSRLQQIENQIQEEKIAKHSMEIDSNLERLTVKYPDVPKEEVLAKIINLQAEGKAITAQSYEKAFQEVDAKHEQIYKARYSKLVGKQTQANKKARDVDAGGGTPGRAPAKFKSLKDVTSFAEEQLTRKG